MDLCWTCLETCRELPKSHYFISYIAIWWINSKVPEGCSMITSVNKSVARESSRVIILKSRLNSTGHSSCTSEVHDIFDRQTHVPNDWWQLMCSRVLQPRDRCNSTTAPVRNITGLSLYSCRSWVPKLTVTIIWAWGTRFRHLKPRKHTMVEHFLVPNNIKRSPMNEH